MKNKKKAIKIEIGENLMLVLLSPQFLVILLFIIVMLMAISENL